MGTKNNNAALKKFMRSKGLTRRNIAEALCVDLSTVDRWLVPPRKVSRRQMPDMAIKLLNYMNKCGDFGDDITPEK